MSPELKPYEEKMNKTINVMTSEFASIRAGRANPANDGTVLRLTFPQLTEERRKEIVKQVSRMAEESKVAIRSIRRDANDRFKAMKKNGEATEDDVKSLETQMQKLTDKFVEEIEKLAAAKEKEVLSI